IIVITNVKLFDLWYVVIFTLPLVAIWYFISNRMHKGYQATLKSTLARSKDQHAQTIRGFTIPDVLEKGIHHQAEDRVMYALKLMEKLEPALFENSLIRLAKSDSTRIRAFAEEKI